MKKISVVPVKNTHGCYAHSALKFMILTLALAAGVFFASCGETGIDSDSTTAGTTPEDTAPEGTTAEETSADEQKSAVPETLKILAIGNSFSVDGMEYLYNIAESAGVKEIVLGNLYIGGCSLETHLNNSKSDAAAYKYYKNTEGKWIATENQTLSYGLLDEDWDYISLQQSSPLSGKPDSYGKILTDLIAYVNENKTNPDAVLMWHMTWAYQSDSTHASFPDYGSDQKKMYDSIISAVKQNVSDNKDITIIIPSGTSVQNARTSFTGDKLTRDGYHLDLTLGRYIAGLTWYAAITGMPIDDIAYAPEGITPEVMAMAKDSVRDAIKTPFEVTASTHTKGTWTPPAAAVTSAPSANAKPAMTKAADSYAADKTLAATKDIDLDTYTLLEWNYVENSYYNSANSAKISTPSEGSTYKAFVCTDKVYEKSEIPENSVVIVDAGWKYRPETWESLTAIPKRRDNVTANILVLDTGWWGDAKFIAFNVSNSGGTDISADYAGAASHVRIYIPKA